jgi:uncharacterized membrane protein
MRRKGKGGEKEMKRIVLLLTVAALVVLTGMAAVGPASAQSYYNYCWAYDYYYGWYWYYC